MTTAARVAPRWRGEPGWFEIWFAVAFAEAGDRAWWLRYTTFAPVAGGAWGTVWAAAFRTGAPPISGKTAVGPEDVHRDVRALADGRARGRVAAGGHTIAWDLRLDGGDDGPRAPAWLHRLPAPTRVEHVRSETAITGTVTIDGARETVAAVGALKHLWGTRRVEELFWVYCPRLEGGGALEATTVRVRRGTGPAVSPVWLCMDAREHRWWTVPGILRPRVVPDGPGRLRVVAASATRRLDAVAACDPATLAGYVYRDPSGFDLHVAQSDVARLDGTLRTRPHPLAAWSPARPLSGRLAAVEFHHPEPLPGVRYVAWDATSA